MRGTVIFAFLFFFSISTYSQINFNKHKLITILDTARKDEYNGNLRNFPFQIGSEIWIPFKENSRGTRSFGYIFFFDINLWKKMVFFKTEYGYIVSSDDKPLKYYSLSLNYKFAEINNKHKFYGALGLCAITASEKNEGWVSIESNFKYLFVLNKYIGLSTGIRLLGTDVISENLLSNSFFHFGIQFFH